MTLVAAHHGDGGWIAEKHVAPRFFGFLEKASCGESSSCTKPDHDNHLISSLADGFPKLTRIRSNQKRFRPSDVCRYASLHLTPTLWSKPGNAAAQEEPTDNNSTIIIGFELKAQPLFPISSSEPLLQATITMAPAQIAIPAPLRPSTTPSTFRHARDDLLQPDESSIETVDALVRHRARRDPHVTIVSYPSSGVDFVDYTMQQLDVFAYRVARHYQTFIPTRSSSAEMPTTVAVLGPSNMDYIVSMLALTKLGHTVLFLSTRISQAAIDSLITTTGATYLLADSRYAQSAIDAQKAIPGLQIGEIARPDTYNFPVEVHADTRLDYQLDHTVEASNIIYIIHSSGMFYMTVC